ncbi:MAG: winged helix-turn-helix domain-containing protein [Blastocatellia bacterium]
MPITAKAFDLLVVLIENHGQTISKEGLVQKVWPEKKVVTDNTFSVTLTSARKALGDSAKDHRYIVKTPGGYRFVADLRRPPADGERRSNEAYATSDISTVLRSFLGGHWKHSLFAGGLYAALYAVALLGEIAYQFDIYGRTGVWVSLVVFGWIFATSVAGLATDWKLTSAGSSRGLAVAFFIFLCAALIVFAGACLFLPTNPVTEMNWQAYTAQAAYLKDIFYFLILKSIFLLPPFHFVLAMQRELQVGRHQSALSLSSPKIG